MPSIGMNMENSNHIAHKVVRAGYIATVDQVAEGIYQVLTEMPLSELDAVIPADYAVGHDEYMDTNYIV